MNALSYICCLKLNYIMKHDVFNQYVERVSDLFSIKKEDIFSKSKKRELVDARHLVYYLCSKRPMQITYIQKYMNEAGYDITHSSIIHGIASVERKIADDKDYVSVVKDVEKAVFI
jgi:chromosomal replication initiation ATPase DnaA